MGKIRGTHSSPGIYTQMNDLQYAANTLGITTLGLVGETIKGPAFEPIMIHDAKEFVDVFGDTSAELFKDSKYPKYELPYIAKSYLKASDQLYVCRVLGFSGYNAGAAFVISVLDKDNKAHVVAVLRSRGNYKKYANLGDVCNPISKYDTLDFDCDTVELAPYVSWSIIRECKDSGETTSATTATTEDIVVSPINFGQFTIVCKKDGEEVGRYPVSLNPGAKDYVYKVLGSAPDNGSAAVFVEELYDTMLQQGAVAGNFTKIKSTVDKFNELGINAVTDPVRDFVTIPAANLKRANVAQTFVYAEAFEDKDAEDGAYVYHKMQNGVILAATSNMQEGHIYRVKKYVSSDNVKSYVYVPVMMDSGDTTVEATVGKVQSSGTTDIVNAVYNLNYDAFVALNDTNKVMFVSDMSDYHEAYRCASTPWIVSEIKGTDATRAMVKKLFRFHTITDGNYANQQVKVSIANIKPDDGTFDVYVRDFYDSDANPVILESYKNLTMVPTNPKYIGLQIGTLDGAYESQSKYVMVEIIENDETAQCIPAGFLGYPVRDYGSELLAPTFEYNLYYDDNIKEKRQYFGLSDLTGIDVDMLNYKGKNAYTDNYAVGYTDPFHLDSTLSKEILKSLNITVMVDDDTTTEDLNWNAVSVNNVVDGEDKAPVIGSEEEMEGTIYEDVKLRKFTVCFYGGFDGWDIYRKSRTNTNEFKANKYKGTIINGHGATFSRMNKPEIYSLSGNCITSDYYAYLAGINQFENPERYIINLFATPGIDYVNNELLVKDAIDMVEERLDTLYITTTPDKPWGAGDAADEMYSSADAAANLEDVGISTYYAATYYPWVKYFDKNNNIYINLPVTKDVLRNMADVDVKRFPWIAPAGMERGNIECAKMHFYAKLEDRDNLYDGRINPLMSYPEGVRVWGNKTMYECLETDPMNRINAVRLMLYMRKLIIESSRGLLFEPNDGTLKEEFDSILRPILRQIKADRGITDFILKISQTPEQMDMHELSCALSVKPTPDLEYIEIEFNVTPQGVEFL